MVISVHQSKRCSDFLASVTNTYEFKAEIVDHERKSRITVLLTTFLKFR